MVTLIRQPNNNPSPLAANVLAALANPNVMNQVNAAFAVPNVTSQAQFLKSYSGFTTYTSFGQSGPYNVVNIDPHPLQTNPVVWGNQWTNATVPCPAGTAAGQLSGRGADRQLVMDRRTRHRGPSPAPTRSAAASRRSPMPS